MSIHIQLNPTENYFSKFNKISALWDFVRIIYQKQNRLKFIIMTLNIISAEIAISLSYLADLKESSFLLAGHVLLVPLAKGQQCLKENVM